MSDMLARGADWLASKLKAKVGRAVTYRRGAESVAVTATVGQTLLKLVDDLGGVQMVWTDRDYLLTPADLVIEEVVVLPEKGDVIADVTGDIVKLYEVLPYGGEPVYRIDAHDALLRVHTKFIGVEE